MRMGARKRRGGARGVGTHVGLERGLRLLLDLGGRVLRVRDGAEGGDARGAGRGRGDAERVRRERRTLGEGDASVGAGGERARARGGRARGARRARRRDGRAAEDGVRGHGRHCSMPFRVRMRAERVRRGPRAVAPGSTIRRAREEDLRDRRSARCWPIQPIRGRGVSLNGDCLCC